MHKVLHLRETKFITALLIVCLALTLVAPLASDQAVYGAGKDLENSFRNGAYIHEQFDYDSIEEVIQFDKIDYIMYAFIEPYSNGALKMVGKEDKLRDMVEAAHKNNVLAFASIGGSMSASDLEIIAASADMRTRFCNAVVVLVENYGLDGIDMDWESPAPGTSAENCEKLMIQLKDRLEPLGIYFTGAVAGSYWPDKGHPATNGWTDGALEAFDWIHIMTYSMQTVNAPYHFADESLQYWHNVRNVPKNKLTVGVPLFALPSWYRYKDLVEIDKENAYKDYIAASPNGLESYYDGVHMIKEKTKLALGSGGGIFTWTSDWDTTDQETSITTTIYNTIKEAQSVGVNTYLNRVAVIFQGREIIYNDNSGYPFVDQNSRTMVPFRQTAEAAGFTVSFDNESRVAIAVKGSTTMRIPIDEAFMNVNGNYVEIDTNAVIVQERTYIPMRAFFEGAGYTVTNWNSSSKTVYAE